MNITVTHTLMLSEEAKAFLTELFGRSVVSSTPRAGMSVQPIDPVAAVEALPIEPMPEPERKKVVPPGISCTRIGQDTAAEIMKLLPADIETIEKAIKRKRFDAEALLKLLWERNKLGYDGEVYHELT